MSVLHLLASIVADCEAASCSALAVSRNTSVAAAASLYLDVVRHWLNSTVGEITDNPTISYKYAPVVSGRLQVIVLTEYE